MPELVAPAPLTREKSTVGVVGWGKMGREIGGWLLRDRWSVVATDVSAGARAAAAEAGARSVAGAAEVAAASDLVLVVVVDDAQVRDVLGGPDGVLGAARPGTVVAVSASIRPDTCREMAGRAAAQRVHLMDAALVGGEHGARTGGLTLMCGGAEAVLDACRPALAAFATHVCLVGPVGAGQVAKMVNNLLLFAALRADYEALRLARALGVEPNKLRPFIGAGSGANRALTDWAYHHPNHPRRGVERSIAVAEEAGVPMPLFQALAPLLDGFDATVLDEVR
ncbi:NAD(P)-binding domain-containing protein [Phytohabitans sp. ZYX-F-186]|uniref:NAD(P)-binding domain-containing protein n=1 Tax=Phytohabitans maris TaxID=3071409 RepID=A0ABU0ZPE0_9ACTN|nr:NAD(P)-binding domain-containing protein [Phytohabitans sp. ZYX-F-186]MDQ7908913.1 NAD(P)-binding domain-containing protein [Phytohabitans sp. ZYX-F-186]